MFRSIYQHFMHLNCRRLFSGVCIVCAQGDSRYTALTRSALLSCREVESILLSSSGAAEGATLTDGTEMRAGAVLVNADPFVLQKLAGEQNLPAPFNSFIGGLRREGSTMKVNLALRELPTFKCLPERLGQHCSTTHLLPDEDVVIESLTQV